MRKKIKVALLRALKAGGVFRLVRDSQWRRQRLLILCYHGIALEDEHLWRPALYIQPAQLERRLRALRQGGYEVLPLSEGLRRLAAGTLPPRSVALTFDDGMYDFYKEAYPLLRRYGFPATVYQTTYFTTLERPVFNVICSYMLWKRREKIVEGGSELGLPSQLDLRTAASRQQIVSTLQQKAQREGLSGEQEQELAGKLAHLLGIDFKELVSKRILQLMNAREIAQLAKEGVDFQLHTHRHRTPMDEVLFRREIQDNRRVLREVAGASPLHFCYPSGVYDMDFLPWLAEEKVISATTCDTGLATAQHNPLLLPRYIDATGQSDIEFESWLTGAAEFLPRRKPEARD